MNMKKVMFDDNNFDKIQLNHEKNGIQLQINLIQAKLFGLGCLVFPVLEAKVADLPKIRLILLRFKVRVRDGLLQPCQLTQKHMKWLIRNTIKNLGLEF